MPFYLGVDGGGTKTAFVLIDASERPVATATGPSTYSLPLDRELIRRVLTDGIRAVTTAIGITPSEIDHAFFALPGYGETTPDIPVLDGLPGAVLGHARYTVGNDMIAGWAGSLGGEDGINVVAGTGSIAYGEWDGRSARVGGWGEIVGDEGSGYWTAVRGVNAFSRMSDGRLPRGPLYDVIRETLPLTADLDVIGLITAEWAGDRTRIAALSHTVAEAAERGDAVSLAILHEGGAELAQLVSSVRAALEIPVDRLVRVSYSGGMFAVPTLLDAFASSIDTRSQLVQPIHAPGIGAALYASRQARKA